MNNRAFTQKVFKWKNKEEEESLDHGRGETDSKIKSFNFISSVTTFNSEK
jgi:hypothetical protein